MTETTAGSLAAVGVGASGCWDERWKERRGPSILLCFFSVRAFKCDVVVSLVHVLFKESGHHECLCEKNYVLMTQKAPPTGNSQVRLQAKLRIFKGNDHELVRGSKITGRDGGSGEQG